MPPNMNSPRENPDAEIVSRLARGDVGALQDLMDRHWSQLVAYAGRMVPSTSDPQDLAQGVFLKLWERRKDLKAGGSLRGLLYTMVRNASLDELRRVTRRSKAESTAPLHPPPPTPYQDTQGAELERAAAAAVSALPPKRQEIFRLIREEGLSYQEVARVLDLSPQTVANHMSLALADLRVALRPFLREASTPGSPVQKDREEGGPRS